MEVAALAKKNVGAAWLIPEHGRAVRITIIPKHDSDHSVAADQADEKSRRRSHGYASSDR